MCKCIYWLCELYTNAYQSFSREHVSNSQCYANHTVFIAELAKDPQQLLNIVLLKCA